MQALVITIFFILFALLKTPLFAIIAGISIVLFISSGDSLVSIIIEFFRLTTLSTLVALPLFTFTGYVLSESQAPKRIINFLQNAFAGSKWAIAVTTLLVCAVFTAFTGASGVTIIAIGGLVYPILIKQGYSDKYTLGLVTTSGSLGLLFPPSLPIILYGTVSKTSIDDLFIAGILPGMLLIALLAIYSFFVPNKQTQIQSKFVLKKFLSSLYEVVWEIPIPFIIIFLIFSGIITLTEASVITAFYVIIVEFFIKKDLSIKKDFVRITQESMVMVGGILIILAMALGLTSYLILEQIPMQLFDYIETFISNKYIFLLLLNIFLIIVGCMMDIFSAIIVVVPIIVPVAKQFDIDLVHLGIIFLANLEIGYLTPPVGLNLFISAFRFKKSVLKVYAAAIPFILVLLIGLLLITYWPKLSLLFIH